MREDRLISLNAAVDALWHSIECENGGELQSYAEAVVGDAEDALKALPSPQLNLSEAYSKAVFTWLMNYQIRTAELKGRYTPYEVLSWVINDWRKENG